MTPVEILATIKAGFEFGTEALRFLQTDEGRKLINQSMQDRKAWDDFWANAGRGVKSLFTGELFK